MKRIFVVLAAALLLGACTTVDTYEVAIKKNEVTGKVSDETYGQGFRFAILSSYTKYDLREHQHPRDNESDILDVLTSDQLRVDVDAAFRYRVDPNRVHELYIEIGSPEHVDAFVYNAFRSAVRDAVAGVTAQNLLSEERAGIAPNIQERMERVLGPRGIIVTDFFLRGIDPPRSIRTAVEEKLAREQQVEAEAYQTQIVMERANQRREEASGIRDAQRVIAESLVGEAGRAYLAYEGLQALKEAAAGENNLIISPSENGLPLMRPIGP